VGTSDNNRKAKFYSITARPQTTSEGRGLLAAAQRRDGRVLAMTPRAISDERPEAGRGPHPVFFRQAALDADLEAEIAVHIELAVEENIRRGLTRLKPPPGAGPLRRNRHRKI